MSSNSGVTQRSGDLLFRLDRARQKLEQYIEETLGRQLVDLDIGQAMLIVRLAERGEISAGTFRNLCYTGTNPSYNLRKLESAGYISNQRSREDRRKVFFTVTKKGADLVEKIKPILASIEEEVGASGAVEDLERAVYDYLATIGRPHTRATSKHIASSTNMHSR